MKAALVVAISLLVLTGCASTPTSVALPDGSQGYSVACNGNASTISDCMNAAAKHCGGRYTVIAQESGAAGGIIAPTGNLVIPISRRSLIYKCDKQ